MLRAPPPPSSSRAPRPAWRRAVRCGSARGACACDAAHGMASAASFASPLRVDRLFTLLWAGDDGIEEDDEMQAAVIAVCAQELSRADFLPSLTELSLNVLLRPAALEAVVDVVLARELRRLVLDDCSLEPDCAMPLARLLRAGGALTSLVLRGGTLLDEGALVTLAEALRANRTLTTLSLSRGVELWHSPTPAAALPFIQALTGHPSLQTLELNAFVSYGNNARQEMAGAALGALLAANAPALTELNISGVELWNAGHTPLFNGLAKNTHLRTLRCNWTRVSAECASDVVLPCTLRRNRAARAGRVLGLYGCSRTQRHAGGGEPGARAAAARRRCAGAPAGGRAWHVSVARASDGDARTSHGDTQR